MAAMKDAKDVLDKMTQVCEACQGTHCHNCTFHLKLDNGDTVELYNREIVKVIKKGECNGFSG